MVTSGLVAAYRAGRAASAGDCPSARAQGTASRCVPSTSLDTRGPKLVFVFALHHERDPLPQRLMRPDLVVEPQAACDLLCELGCVGKLAAVECSYSGRALEAFDGAVGLGSVVARAGLLTPAADMLPTDESQVLSTAPASCASVVIGCGRPRAKVQTYGAAEPAALPGLSEEPSGARPGAAPAPLRLDPAACRSATRRW